jgi:integrase
MLRVSGSFYEEAPMSEGTVFPTTGRDGVVTWRGKFFDARGKRQSVTFGREDQGWSKKQAKAAMQEIVVDVRRGDRVEPSKLTVSAFVEGWFDSYAVTRGLKRTTRLSYRLLLGKHVLPEFGHKRLSAVDAATIEQWTAKQLRQGSSPRAVNSRLQVLGLVLSEAVRLDYIQSNPAAKVKRIRERRADVPVMTTQEYQRVLDAYDQLVAEATGPEAHDWAASRLQYLLTHRLGLRKGEALGLRWRSVTTGEQASVTIAETFTASARDTPKSDASRRTLRIGADLARDLAAHRLRSPYSGQDEYVLAGRSGRPLDAHAHSRMFRSACERANVDPSRRPNHDGRHSALTRAAASKQISAWQLQQFAGHSSISTTQRYVHAADEGGEVAEAIEQAWRGGEAVEAAAGN